jgi:hypothetical protein
MIDIFYMLFSIFLDMINRSKKTIASSIQIVNSIIPFFTNQVYALIPTWENFTKYSIPTRCNSQIKFMLLSQHEIFFLSNILPEKIIRDVQRNMTFYLFFFFKLFFCFFFQFLTFNFPNIQFLQLIMTT